VTRPGFAPDRLVRLARRAVEEMRIDLTGRTVLTEAATGAYAVTPVIAALAGAAHVTARAKATRYGSVAEVRHEHDMLYGLAGVGKQITFTDEPIGVETADIVTNSGHLRPLDAEFASRMKPGSVVPLMFEAWELDRDRADLDLQALVRRGVRVAGTNERHPQVRVFEELGPMAVRELGDAGIAVLGLKILVLCDNPFAPYLVRGLDAAGADVSCASCLNESDTDGYDVILVAQRPRGTPVFGAKEAARAGTAIVVQYWGDIDRDALTAHNVPYWPLDAPGSGHMAVLPSAIGPEPIVRLQAAGLKVGQVLLMSAPSAQDLAYVDPLPEGPA
jgi:hypothetical protein